MQDERLRDGAPSSLDIGNDHCLTLTTTIEAGDDLAILQNVDGRPKCRVDVAIRIEHVLNNSLQAAVANAVQRGADKGTAETHPMATATVSSERLLATLDRCVDSREFRPAFGHQSLTLDVNRREIRDKSRDAIGRPGNVCSLQFGPQKLTP